MLATLLTLSRGICALAAISIVALKVPHAHDYLLCIFLFGALSDMLDGEVARRMGTVSDFGKVFDPLFDKVLVFVFLILLYPLDVISPVIIQLLIIRDLIIDASRSFIMAKGTVIPAIWTAKAKTACTFLMIICALLTLSSPSTSASLATQIFAWLALGFSYTSAFQYALLFWRAYRKPVLH